MTAATQAALAVLLGSAFSVGALLVLARVPRWGAPRLADRIAPYLRDITDPLGIPVAGGSGFRVDGVVRRVRARAARAAGSSTVLARRLRQADRVEDVAAFRIRQIVWAIAGLVAGGVVLVVLALIGMLQPAAAALPPILAVTAAVAADVLLTRAAAARVGRIEEELPTVLEFLSLCLAAGESILDALRRVGGAGAGELAEELRRVMIAVATGIPLPDALRALVRDLDVPPLSRSIDHLLAALDRGAPLAQVLQAQASDAREEAKRRLLEQAGRREIAMLFPLVFLILPLSVLFAIFPGIFMLRVGIG